MVAGEVITQDEWRRARIDKLEQQRAVLLDYAQMKLDQEDWHGLQDAGGDLRDLDVELNMLKKEAGR